MNSFEWSKAKTHHTSQFSSKLPTREIQFHNKSESIVLSKAIKLHLYKIKSKRTNQEHRREHRRG